MQWRALDFWVCRSTAALGACATQARIIDGAALCSLGIRSVAAFRYRSGEEATTPLNVEVQSKRRRCEHRC